MHFFIPIKFVRLRYFIYSSLRKRVWSCCSHSALAVTFRVSVASITATVITVITNSITILTLDYYFYYSFSPITQYSTASISCLHATVYEFWLCSVHSTENTCLLPLWMKQFRVIALIAYCVLYLLARSFVNLRAM